MIVVGIIIGLIALTLVVLRVNKLRRDAQRFISSPSTPSLEVRPTIRVVGSDMPQLSSMELHRPSIDKSKNYVFGDNSDLPPSFPTLRSPREKWAIERSGQRSRWPRGSAKILSFALVVITVLLVAGTLLAQR
jgi:hypothetical protein